MKSFREGTRCLSYSPQKPFSSQKYIFFSSTSFSFVEDRKNVSSFLTLQIDQTIACQIIERPPIDFTLPPKKMKLSKRLLRSLERTICQPNIR